MNSLFDASGIYIQQKYLTGFLGLPQNLNISTNLLQNEAQINKILNDETNRLMLKEKSVDNALNTQNRMLLLNSSYRYRYSQYNKIIGVIIITLIILFLINMVKETIPEFIVVLLNVIVLSISIIYCIYIYYYLTLKDRINYNQLISDRNGPNVYTSTQVSTEQTKASISGNLFGINYNPNICQGQQCCGTGQVWDASNNICDISTNIQTFTTLKNDNTNNYYKNEFDKYSIYT
jgi:hypothetical protein